jgi:hypothetical protein
MQIGYLWSWAPLQSLSKTKCAWLTPIDQMLRQMPWLKPAMNELRTEVVMKKNAEGRMWRESRIREQTMISENKCKVEIAEVNVCWRRDKTSDIIASEFPVDYRRSERFSLMLYRRLMRRTIGEKWTSRKVASNTLSHALSLRTQAHKEFVRSVKHLVSSYQS